MFRYTLMALVLAFSFHKMVRNEAFGNNALIIPKIGAAFFDNSLSLNRKPWGLAHQWTFGTSFMQALNYRWWWLMDTNFAIGPLSKSAISHLSAFMGGAGVRYNILQDNFRPHLTLMLHYVHFLGENTKHLPLDVGWPIFVGLKPSVGLEWLVGSELGVLVEAGYGIYININEPFRHIYYAGAGAAFYF